MNLKTFHPSFPETLPRKIPVWVDIGDRLMSLTPITIIPMYTFYKENSRNWKRLKMEYDQQIKKEYDELKELYDRFVYVGTVFGGNSDVTSAKISRAGFRLFSFYVR